MANLMTQGPKKTPEIIEKELEDAKRIAQLTERTRLLEERVKQTFQKIQVIDETNMKKVDDLKNKIKNGEDQLSSLRKEIDEMKEILRRVAKDMGQTAKISDVRVLEKYINMVDITRIVTKEDIYRILEEHELEKKRKKKVEV